MLTTFEEQEARLKEICRELVSLSPIRQELLTELRATEGKIEKLCAEKNYIERTRIKVTVCRTGASGRTQHKEKPVSTKQAVGQLDKAQTEELLKTLLRMQREMRKDEEETRQAGLDDEHPAYEPYDERDEEEEEDE